MTGYQTSQARKDFESNVMRKKLNKPGLRFSRQKSLFVKDNRGISAIEFALIFPIMIAVFFGVVEISDALTIDRRVATVAGTMADLVAQAKEIDDTEIANIFTASQAIISPYNENDLSIVISSVVTDKDGKSEVDWSDTQNGTARTSGETINLPSGLNEPNGSVILAEVNYKYRSFIGWYIVGELNLAEEFYLKPRLTPKITRN